MSRFTDARLELAYALDDDPIGRRDEIATLREEVAALATLFVRRYQAAMAFITAEQAFQRTGTGEAYRGP